MNTKLAYFFLLGASLVIAFLIGRVIAKHFVSRLLGIILTLTGAIAFIIGGVMTDHDPRFRLLMIGGFCLQVAGAVSNSRRRRTFREHSVDLWAPQK